MEITFGDHNEFLKLFAAKVDLSFYTISFFQQNLLVYECIRVRGQHSSDMRHLLKETQYFAEYKSKFTVTRIAHTAQ